MDRYRISTTSINGVPSPSISPRPTSLTRSPKPLSHLPNPRRLDDDAELSIFDAQRYFSDSTTTTTTTNDSSLIKTQNSDLSINPRDSSVSSVDTFSRNYRNISYHATPTASSEASWNSQSGLLTNPHGATAISVRAFPSNDHKKLPPFSTRRRFPRPCPCSGKKSIDVEEKYSEPKTPMTTTTTVTTTSLSTAAKLQTIRTEPIPADVASEKETKMKILADNWAKERAIFRPAGRFSPESRFTTSRFLESGGFSFPVLKPQASLDDPARDSLEVFRPNRHGGFPFPGSPRAADDDVGSDASSDLFELESFSAYKRRDSLDDTAAAAGRLVNLHRSIEIAAAAAEPSEGYAPSEVSVEWSVTTAEGFDRASAANFSSAASDYDEARFVRAAEPDRASGKRRGSGLLSCVCEKAVSVGPSPVRFVPEPQRWIEPDRVHPVLVRSNSARMCRSMVTR
ncbi:protein PHYTOCHROME KINASE SUBSTRATE 4-like [Dioscorea cayenensis subsp. rotundata]|uniref:Protein PHYTOCHROME KINASE SUBSTRATE 4-like n=1 Tax=Dioscorea cayennensis subsp. rotundata TaxID=55577 RepID=A0AB40BR43_DIOCR|nr:protein PHYTOCHROME KINASE SUBSTRATE 4-like [Dioscorea cayenensis subsp. rotundata]